MDSFFPNVVIDHTYRDLSADELEQLLRLFEDATTIMQRGMNEIRRELNKRSDQKVIDSLRRLNYAR